MADTTQGAATMPTSVTSISASVSSSATRSSSVRTSSSDRLLRAAPRIGTKACAKAPSANSRRSRFGMRKATQNASVMGPAPKARATRTSRARPEMRDSNVKLLTVAAERTNSLQLSINPGLARSKNGQCPNQERGGMSPASQTQTHTLHTHQRTDHAIQGADTLPTTHIRPSPSGPHGASFAGPWRRPRGSAQRGGEGFILRSVAAP